MKIHVLIQASFIYRAKTPSIDFDYFWLSMKDALIPDIVND